MAAQIDCALATENMLFETFFAVNEESVMQTGLIKIDNTYKFLFKVYHMIRNL